MAETTVGIIGGTGLYNVGDMAGVRAIEVDTPFGKPSSPISCVEAGNVTALFIARHGPGHQLLPSEVNSRANIYALKSLGAVWCISVSAVGSLREELRPGDVVVPDQLLDRTKDRPSTFFGDGLVAHVQFADPFCPVLRKILFETVSVVTSGRRVTAHDGGTYVCMEGPAFSTRAEAAMHRMLEASVIGMTALPEAKLAREAELAYAALAMVTDYDCWHTQSDVDVPEILRVMKANAEVARETITQVLPRLAASAPSSMAADALKHAFLTRPDLIPAKTKEKLKAIVSRYLF